MMTFILELFNLFFHNRHVSFFEMAAIDKPSKFHISTQLESTARDILAARAEDRIQAGHFMRTQEMPVNSKLQGFVCLCIYY